MHAESRSRSLDAFGAIMAALVLAVGLILFLLGYVIQPPLGKISKEAGLVVIGTVLVTFVYELVLRRQHDRYVLRLVENCLVLNGPKYGLAGIDDRLSFQKLFEKLERGDELLWLDTYCPDQPNFQEALRVALDRGASVRMLAVNPDSTVAKYRAQEIKTIYGYSYNRFRAEARGQIEHLQEVLADAPAAVRQRVQVRLYDDLPCVPMYIHVRNGRPSTAFTGFFLGAPTFAEPHLKWSGSPEGFLQRFYDYFELKWAAHQGTAISLEPVAARHADLAEEQRLEFGTEDTRQSSATDLKI